MSKNVVNLPKAQRRKYEQNASIEETIKSNQAFTGGYDLVKALSKTVVININDYISRDFKFEKHEKTPYDGRMLSIEEKILNFIKTELGVSEPRAGVLCNEWVNAFINRKLELPDKAPALYVGKPGRTKEGKDIIEFLRDTYGIYMQEGVLTRPALKRLDPKAYMALSNWLRSGEPLPVDIKIPTKTQVIDHEISISGLKKVKQMAATATSLAAAAARRNYKR